MRFVPSKSFPTYAYVPGVHPHPNKEGGHSFGLDEPLCDSLEVATLENECFWFGVDLYNHQYFWEAHVWWEEVWKKSKKNKADEAFVKGLIKIAAGSLKLKMNQADLARDHFLRAKELLGENYQNIHQDFNIDTHEWDRFFQQSKNGFERLPLSK